MGVFGRGRGIVLRPILPTDGGPRAPLRRTDVRQLFIAFARRLEEEGPWVGRQGGQPDGLGRGTSADLRAFGRVCRLEHEGPRHRGERQVERHVDEDRQNEQSPVPHSPILTHKPALTASPGRGTRWSPTQCLQESKCTLCALATHLVSWLLSQVLRLSAPRVGVPRSRTRVQGWKSPARRELSTFVGLWTGG